MIDLDLQICFTVKRAYSCRTASPSSLFETKLILHFNYLYPPILKNYQLSQCGMLIATFVGNRQREPEAVIARKNSNYRF
jgi:hypothetical protein